MQKILNACSQTAVAGMQFSELEKILKERALLPAFRAKQIYNWIIKGARDFNEMKNIPLSLQDELKNMFTLFSSEVSEYLDDNDTKKIIIKLYDGCKIESVLLNDGKERYTACLSTQAGCPAGCVFCKTGSLKFARNLDCTEIVEQFFHLMQKIDKSESIKKHIIDNIVVMGMGEPFLNLENLKKAVSVFTDPKGLNFSLRRITVSTCGITESLFNIAQNGPFFRLALSLLTADEPLRQRLMPVTLKNPLKKIKEALALYQQNGGGRVTLEVPLLGGINTRKEDALSIAEFSKGLNTVINIIPWNPVGGLSFNGKPLCRPEKKETSAFINMLKNYKLKVTTRLHKGRCVMAACGQLGAD